MLHFFFSSRRRHTRWPRDWSSDVCSSDLIRARVDLRERVVSFPPQPVITEDNLTLAIDTVVYFQVTNPQAAVYRSEERRVGKECNWRGSLVDGNEKEVQVIDRRGSGNNGE